MNQCKDCKFFSSECKLPGSEHHFCERYQGATTENYKTLPLVLACGEPEKGHIYVLPTFGCNAWEKKE